MSKRPILTNGTIVRASLADVQPRGRVRLGDQAERARFDEFLSRNPLMALCAGTAWQVWQAALSAQPSPGEGDALAIEKRARELLAKEWETLSFDAPVEELRAGCELPPVVAAGVRAIVSALSSHPFPDGQRDNSDLLAGLRDVEEHLYCAGSNPSHTAIVRAAINALSAQPSPGGQGEVCVPLPTPGNGEWSDGWNACRDAMLRGEGEALAARQPVESEENVAADTYWTLAEMIEPHVQREGVNPDGALPASVHDSVAILLEHWLRARQPVGEPVAIPEGWALVDLAEYTVLPQIPTTAMMDAGWPIGEQITDRFDVKGAYADLIAEHDAKGEGRRNHPRPEPASRAGRGPWSSDQGCVPAAH